MLQKCLIAFAEAVAIVFPSRWRDGRVAKLGVLVDAWRQVAGNIAARGFESVVVALTGYLAERGRGSVDDHRLRAGAPGYREDGQE
jgi:hypothetical protein